MNNKYKYEDESNDDEKYIIQTKMCKRLSKEFGIEDFPCDEMIEYKSPHEKYGLENSDVIIPSYYQLHKLPSKFLDLDFYEIIKDDIRNCRKLNAYQITYIKNLKEDYKNELIELLNQSLGCLVEIIENASECK